MIKDKRIRADVDFVNKLEKIYPNSSHREATHKLNKFIDEVMHGGKEKPLLSFLLVMAINLWMAYSITVFI